MDGREMDAQRSRGAGREHRQRVGEDAKARRGVVVGGWHDRTARRCTVAWWLLCAAPGYTRLTTREGWIWAGECKLWCGILGDALTMGWIGMLESQLKDYRCVQ